MAYPKHTKLKHREFRDLLQRAQAGDTEARNTIWAANARLVYAIANKSRFDHNFTADILQELQFVILRSIRLFNRDLGFEFSTYVIPAGQRDIQRIAPLITYRVRVGVGPTTRWFQAIHRVVRNGHGPQNVRDVVETRPLCGNRTKAFAARAYQIHDAASISTAPSETLPLVQSLSPLEFQEQSHQLKLAMKGLSDREKYVLFARHGLGGRPPRRLEDLANEIGLTRERVRQIQVQAERHIRDALILRGFDPPRPRASPLSSPSTDPSPYPPAPEAPITP